MILNKVKEIRSYIPRIGGGKMHKMLIQDPLVESCLPGRDNFYKLLRENNLLIKPRKKYMTTTNSNHRYYKWPDLTRDIQISGIDQLWVCDITYITLSHGFAYLSIVTDAYSRKIVGYHLSQSLKVQGCINALNKAIKQLGKDHDGQIIHHSDRGVQYCCDAYVNILSANHINISMTQDGNPYDNAMAERVNGILKQDFMMDQTFESYSEAVAAVATAIDGYNRLRPHMSISDLTPNQAHETEQALKRKWKKKVYKYSKAALSTNGERKPTKIEESRLVDKADEAERLD